MENENTKDVKVADKVVKPVLSDIPKSKPHFLKDPSWYWLIKLDEKGKDIECTDVAVSPSTFSRSFAPIVNCAEPKFRVVEEPTKKK